jgi:hypothetical protein
MTTLLEIIMAVRACGFALIVCGGVKMLAHDIRRASIRNASNCRFDNAQDGAMK